VAGLRKHLGDRPLLDDFAGIHHADAIRDFGNDGKIVGNEDQPHVALGLQRREQVENLRLNGYIQRGGRLVGDQQAWSVGDGGRNHGALALTARQLVWIGVSAQARIGQADILQPCLRLCRCVPARDLAVCADRLRNLVTDPMHGVEAAARILKDHCDLAAAQAAHVGLRQLHEVGRPTRPINEQRLAADDPHRSRQQAEQGKPGQRLARTALADQCQRLARHQRKPDIADRPNRSVRRIDFDRQPFNGQERRRRGRSTRHDAGTHPHEPTCSLRACTRVEHVAKAIAQHIERKDGAGERKARPQQQPGRLLHGGARATDHQPPGRRRRDYAETEKGQSTLQDHGGGNGQRELHQQRRSHVRQDRARENADGPRAQRFLRSDIVEAAGCKRGGKGDARIARRVEDRECDDQGCGARPHQRHDQKRQQDRREADDRLHRAYGEKLDHAPRVSSEQAERRADHAGKCGGQKRDRERDACATYDSRQHVATIFVLSKPMHRRRRRKPRRHVHLHRIGQRQQRRGEREQDDAGHDCGSRHGPLRRAPGHQLSRTRGSITA
jgi:hypothetical protein